MTVEITRPGKFSLLTKTPVMPAAGTVGFGDTYAKLIDLTRLGALVTNPVTYEPWSPAGGTRVVPLDAGVLVHTGLPNLGLSKVLTQYRDLWERMDIPVIVHLVALGPTQVKRAAARLAAEPAVDGIELGIGDEATWEDVEALVGAAVDQAEKPVLARLPLVKAPELAEAAIEARASALVIAAPPRGTARDPITGQLVTGRVYGPLVKPIALHTVAQLRQTLDSDVPIIGAGGIHSTTDARDFLEAGAVAVQVDSVTWTQPKMLERIARDLRGTLVTRPAGSFPDEWNPDMGDTEFRELFRKDDPDPPAETGEG